MLSHVSPVTPRDPMDCNPRGSSVPRIFQARILEWIAVSFSGDLPNPRAELASPVTPANEFFMTEPSALAVEQWKVLDIVRAINRI